MTNDRLILCLPNGFTDKAGTLHREVELRPLTGKVEEQLAQIIDLDSGLPVDLVLGACLQRVGTITPVPPDVTAALSETDRWYLVLELHKKTFGDSIQGRVSCPGPGCGEPVDIDFSIRELVRGGVLEGGAGAELELEVHCPQCSDVFDFPFHPPGFFLGRLKAGLSSLYHDVHTLAYRYHWSEDDILSMPREKRHMYLDILADELASRPTVPLTGTVRGVPGTSSAIPDPGVYSPGVPGMPDRSNRSYRSYWSYKTGKGEKGDSLLPGPLPGAQAAQHAEVTEIQLPGSVGPAAQGAYNAAAQGPYNAAAQGPYNAAVQGPANASAQGPANAAQAPGNAAQEIPGQAQSLHNTVQPPPAASLGNHNGGLNVPESEPSLPNPTRAAAETVRKPFYTDSRPPVPSAFWARSFLGHYHLKTLR